LAIVLYKHRPEVSNMAIALTGIDFATFYWLHEKRRARFCNSLTLIKCALNNETSACPQRIITAECLAIVLYKHRPEVSNMAITLVLGMTGSPFSMHFLF
jgi:hypothetical protein